MKASEHAVNRKPGQRWASHGVEASMSTVPAMTGAERILNRPDIQEMIESLAAKVHEAWANQRKAEGWKWGKVHKADLKQHPCLVGYEELPESEKDVDRRTARTAIQGLLDLGFEVLPPKRKIPMSQKPYESVDMKSRPHS